MQGMRREGKRSEHGKDGERTTVNNTAAYIIHLDRATERAAQVDRQRDALPMTVTVLSAVDGLSSGPELRNAYDPGIGWKPTYPFALNNAEIAVFHSHRRAWQRIVEDGYEAGFILEDDVEFDPELFPQALDLALAEIGPGRFIRFPWKNRENGGSVLARKGVVRLIRPVPAALGMLAQLVHRTAAETLLAATECFDRPVDTALQMTWETNVEVLAVWPSGITEVSDLLGGSTLDKKPKGMGARLRTEAARAFYRRQVSARSRRALIRRNTG